MSDGTADQPPRAGDQPAQVGRVEGIARSSVVMAAGTLTSRVLGLFRTTLLASIVGLTGYTGDAFGVANTLPNQFYLILAGGVFNAVLVPQIVKASTHADGGRDYVNRLLTLGITLLVVATTATTLAAGPLVRLFARFDDPDALTLATVFAYVCLPQIFFYGLYTLLGQVLNAHGRFAAYMWAPVVANIVSLAGLGAFLVLGFEREAPPSQWSPAMVAVLAGSATLSIVLQALFLVIPLKRMGFRYRPVWGFRGVGLGTASQVAKWSFAAVLVAQLGFVVTSRVLTETTTAASLAGVVAPGRNAYDNAFLLFMLPHSLVTVSLATALFTRMSGAVHEGRTDDLRADLLRGLRAPAVLLVPGSIFGVVFGPVLTRAFFFRSSAADTDAVASVMVALFVGIIPFGWLYLSERFFFAHSDARTPFFIQTLVTALAVTSALVASRFDLGVVAPALALGQSLAYAVGAAVGFTLVRRRLGRIGLRPVASAYLRLGVPALAAAIAGLAAMHATLGDPVTRGPLVCIVLTVAAGVLVLGAALIGGRLLGVSEVHDLTSRVSRLLRRRLRRTA